MIFNAQISAILLGVSILASALAVGLMWRWRKTDSGGTIAPYAELKRQVKAATAKPFTMSKAAVKVSPIPWDQILQIPDSWNRYLQMGIFFVDKELNDGYSALSDNEQIILNAYLLEAEVNNGGFDQYFFNTAGNYALDTVESLRRIGAKETLALLTQAIDVFSPEQPSSDRETRWQQMDALPETASEEWNRLNEEFFVLTERLSEFVVTYIERQE